MKDTPGDIRIVALVIFVGLCTFGAGFATGVNYEHHYGCEQPTTPKEKSDAKERHNNSTGPD